jgi:acetyltransferase-like isoleucine patch superfamily enzyme
MRPTIQNQSMKLTVKGKISWGNNVTFGPNCRQITIGYGGFIGNDLYIDVEELQIGDYFTIHHGSVIHGKRCIIGHNVWIGHYSILDALGGLLKLGNNVGIGAHSQLWSHMKFGDRLAGCRWYQMNELIVGDDAWFVGHCLVAPIVVEPKAMLLLGGVAVKRMIKNHIYAGSPAVDVTSKMGYQFTNISITEKEKTFRGYIGMYKDIGNNVDFIRTTSNLEKIKLNHRSYFNLESQEYIPRYTDDEYKFMKFLLYDKAKFIPIET